MFLRILCLEIILVKYFIKLMTEYELDKLCERNPDCGCNCMKCPLMAKYQRSQLGLDDEDDYE